MEKISNWKYWLIVALQALVAVVSAVNDATH